MLPKFINLTDASIKMVPHLAETALPSLLLGESRKLTTSPDRIVADEIER